MLGYLIYRGAIRINLTRFFTWTGAFLILVAAGVLAYGVHDLQEARFLPGLHDLAFDVSDTVDPTTWYGTLLKGIFNFSPATTWLEAAAWLLYVVPRDGALPRRRPPTLAPPSTPAAPSPAAAWNEAHAHALDPRGDRPGRPARSSRPAPRTPTRRSTRQTPPTRAR